MHAVPDLNNLIFIINLNTIDCIGKGSMYKSLELVDKSKWPDNDANDWFVVHWSLLGYT